MYRTADKVTEKDKGVQLADPSCRKPAFLYCEGIRSGCCQAKPHPYICSLLECAVRSFSDPFERRALSGSDQAFKGRYQKADS